MAKLVIESNPYLKILSKHGYKKTPRKDLDEYEHKQNPHSLVYLTGHNYWMHDHNDATIGHGYEASGLDNYLKNFHKK